MSAYIDHRIQAIRDIVSNGVDSLCLFPAVPRVGSVTHRAGAEYASARAGLSTEITIELSFSLPSYGMASSTKHFPFFHPCKSKLRLPINAPEDPSDVRLRHGTRAPGAWTAEGLGRGSTWEIMTVSPVSKRQSVKVRMAVEGPHEQHSAGASRGI